MKSDIYIKLLVIKTQLNIKIEQKTVFFSEPSQFAFRSDGSLNKSLNYFRMNRFPLRRWSSFYQHHSKKSAYLVDKVPIEDHPLVQNTKIINNMININIQKIWP